VRTFFKILSVTSEAQALCGHRLVAPIGATNDAALDRFHNRRREQLSRLKKCFGNAALVKFLSGFIG